MIRILAAGMLVAATVTVSAQATPEHSPDSNTALYTGASFLVRNYTHTQLNPTNSPMPGWDIGFSQPHAFARNLGYIVDFSGHYATSGFFTPGLYAITGGPQFRLAGSRSSEAFVHVTGGLLSASSDVIAQTSSRTIGIFGAGAGFDRAFSPRLAWRAAFDWYYGGFDTKDTNQISEIVRNNIRLSTGPVFRF
jgi:hypothetical protein